MISETTNWRLECDVPGCNNSATYDFWGEWAMIRDSICLFICPRCLKENKVDRRDRKALLELLASPGSEEAMVEIPIVERIMVRYKKPVRLEFESVEDEDGFI